MVGMNGRRFQIGSQSSSPAGITENSGRSMIAPGTVGVKQRGRAGRADLGAVLERLRFFAVAQRIERFVLVVKHFVGADRCVGHVVLPQRAGSTAAHPSGVDARRAAPAAG